MKFSNGVKAVFISLGIGLVCIIGALNWAINGTISRGGKLEMPKPQGKEFRCGDQATVVTQSRLSEMLNRAPLGMCVSRINDGTFVVREMAVIQR
ncbi:hypothetical protein [Obesumbacterium proteus]|uniref:hypothetical protein n=1 Tax=Obesumbacterium proteus TaxID=82983 RepID=UPI000778E1C4|nr:hypothetical protein [Obesumbacterium proteus]AMO82096.1 hypothetical protein DSM2777_14330 [Obesumbacterium proteus]